MKPILLSIIGILTTVICLPPESHGAGAQGGKADPFFSTDTPVSPGVPADGFYPNGKKMAFMGYSGDPARDLTNGFTVAGPTYGDNKLYVEQCAAHGWPVVASVSHGPRFTDKDTSKNYRLNETELRANVAAEVSAIAPLKEIVWWAILPEELRTWRKDEMQYLEIVSDTIRANDPQRRPLYIYNPNNRDAASLAPIARQVDVVGKGCYVNTSGKKRDRAWVGWSIDQEVAAIKAAGRPDGIPILMPELCKDPAPGEEKEIRSWVRHDVYLGLTHGAKGLCLWSLFKRREVSKTWQLWYDAYAECGRELNGVRNLSQVFLFGGEPSAHAGVRLVKGAAMTDVRLGGNAEPVTSSAQERRDRVQVMPSFTAREYVYGGDHWLFVVNSSNDPATFVVSGWPKDALAENAFDSTPIALPALLHLDLPAYGVAAIRFFTRS